MAKTAAKTVVAGLVAACLQLMAATPALSAQDAPGASPAKAAAPSAAARRSNQQFGGPETLKGIITMVRPGNRLVVITRTGGPRSPQASWTQTVARGTNEVVDKSAMTLGEGEGHTDYAFKITDATAIQVGGRKVTLAELAASQNKPATVRFSARRDGDFAISISVGP